MNVGGRYQVQARSFEVSTLLFPPVAQKTSGKFSSGQERKLGGLYLYSSLLLCLMLDYLHH